MFEKSIDSRLRENHGTWFGVKEISKKIIFIIRRRDQQLG